MDANKDKGSAARPSPSARLQRGQDGRSREAVQLNLLMARGVAANQLHLPARTVELFGQELYQGFIGRRIHRGSGHFDAQLVAQRFANFIGGSARLQFDREDHAIGLFGDERLDGM